MEGRKHRRQIKSGSNEGKIDKDRIKEKSTSRTLVTVSRILIILLSIIIIAVLGIVIYLKVLPNKYLIPLCILAITIIFGGIVILFKKKELKVIRVISSVIIIALIGVFSFVALKLMKTMNFLGNMKTETVNAKTYSVVVSKDKEYAKLEDIQYRLLLYYDTELNKNKEAIDKLTEVMTVVAEKTDNVNELANKLIANDVDAILIEDSYYAIIEEEIEDFRDKTKVIYTFTLEDTIETIAKNVSVTKEPFNVFISGIDAYGKISSVARSDVNMLISVNPQTKQAFLVNIPRDYYVKLHGTSGYRDKLTHAGIYGIDMSVKTVEDLFNVDINYYVRVNFTSLINIIDAIGGVNVYSEYAFTSRIGKYKFVKGYNQMNGKQALGFARERYSFSEGDRMRGQNQQAVIDAVIKKVCSSSTILTKFDALLDSLEGSFQTNMDYTKMIELVRMQISDPAEWNVTSIGVDGSGSMERTYSMGKTLLSVLIPYSGSINQAKKMIKSVLAGEILEGGHIDISKYNDYLVVSRGVYEKEKVEKEEKPIQTEKEPAKENTNITPPASTTPTPDSGNTNTTPPASTTPTPDSGNANTTPPASTTPTPDSGNTNTTPPASTTPTPDSGNTNTTPPASTTPTPDSGNTNTTPPASTTPTPDSGNTNTTPPASTTPTPDSGNTNTTPPASTTPTPDSGNDGTVTNNQENGAQE